LDTNGVNGTVYAYVTSTGDGDSLRIEVVGPSPANDPPTATFDVAPSEPTVGETVSFDATGSNDPDGSITSYEWEFGDGTTATGRTVTHDYATAGNYTVALTVTDGEGATNTATRTVRVVNERRVVGETGRQRVTTDRKDDWKRVRFDTEHPDPVVIAKPVSDNGDDPAHVRVRAVNATGFELKVEEFGAQNGHPAETVSWLAMEAGDYSLADGTLVEVGTDGVAGDGFDGEDDVTFEQSFTEQPVVFSQVQTVNDTTPVVTRQQNVDAVGFEHKLQRAEARGKTGHPTETVGYVAIETGRGRNCEDPFEVDTVDVDETATRVAFARNYTDPVIVAGQQTQEGPDTAWVRYRGLAPDGVSVRIEEETTADGEQSHAVETVGYYAAEEDDLIFGNTSAGCSVPTAAVAYGPDEPEPGEPVAFDASESTASDGAIDSYEWQFGDGTTATGQRPTHSYLQEGNYTVTLVVTDESGESNSTTRTVTVQRNETVVGETIRVQTNATDPDGLDWQRVDFDTTHREAVVIAKPISDGGIETPPSGTAAAHLRVRNVTDGGFEFAIERFDGNTTYPTVNVSFLVLETGSYELADGTDVVVGRNVVGESFEAVEFATAFAERPVVFSQAQTTSANETPVITRQRAVSTTTFEHRLQDVAPESRTETVGYVAIENTTGQNGDDPFEVGTVSEVTDEYSSVAFRGTYHDPALIADGQTENGGDTAWVRYRGLTPNGVDVHVDEERVDDSNVDHPGAEEVGYLVTEEDDLLYGVAATPTAPTANATITPRPAAVGEQVTFDATNSTGTGEIVDYEWRFEDGTVGSGATLNRSFDAVGQVNVTLVVTDESGESNSTVRTVTVRLERPVGEAGTVRTGEWTTVEFASSYENPVVVATTNTDDGGQPARTVSVRNVTATAAELRVCASDGADGCEPYGTERVGYLVVDAERAAAVEGVEAGTVSVGAEGTFPDGAVSVDYRTAHATAPVVLANAQTTAGAQPLETRVVAAGTERFEVAICHQTSNDGCDSSRGTETVGWVALEPGALPFDQRVAVGTVEGVRDSDWRDVGFDPAFGVSPAVVASTLTENGGQELQIDEVRNVTVDGAAVRYCELDPPDSCDSHTNEAVGWVAAPPGNLTVGQRQVELRWAEPGDWDASTTEGVVHADFGDHDRRALELGTPVTGDTLAYWPFDGATAADVSAGDYDGTINTGVTTGVEGVQNTTAYEFDGTGWVELPGFPNLQRSFTVAGWIRTDDPDEQGQRILVDDASNTGGYALSVGDPGGGEIRLYSRAQSPVSVDSTTGPIRADSWQFVVGVVDRDADRRRIYVDGKAVANESVSGAIGTDEGVAAIGGEVPGGETENRFDGRIDELRVLDRALSAEAALELSAVQTNGSAVTAVRTLSEPVAADELSLEEVTVVEPTETNVTVIVAAFDGTEWQSSDVIDVEAGQSGPYEVTGLDGAYDRYRLRIRLRADTPTVSPCFGGATLVTDATRGSEVTTGCATTAG
jgi:PKD repeat protein